MVRRLAHVLVFLLICGMLVALVNSVVSGLVWLGAAMMVLTNSYIHVDFVSCLVYGLATVLSILGILVILAAVYDLAVVLVDRAAK